MHINTMQRANLVEIDISSIGSSPDISLMITCFLLLFVLIQNNFHKDAKRFDSFSQKEIHSN